MFQSEAALMQGIIPMKHERRIFDMLIQAGLDSIVKEGEVSHMTCSYKQGLIPLLRKGDESCHMHIQAGLENIIIAYKSAQLIKI